MEVIRAVMSEVAITIVRIELRWGASFDVALSLSLLLAACERKL